MIHSPLRFSISDATISRTDLQRFAQGWILDCEYRQLSPRTLASRRGFVKNLFWWFEAKGYTCLGPMESRAFLSYVATGHTDPGGRWGNPQCTRPNRSRAIKDYYTSLNTFCHWLLEEGYADVSPRHGIRRPDQIQPFSEQQVKSLILAAKTSDDPRRNLAILLFLLDTGVRSSELCALRMSDLDMVSKKAIVLGKGNKHRGVYFGRETARALWQVHSS